MPEATLKFKGLTLPQEISLCNKYGFHVHERNKNEGYLLLAKKLTGHNLRALADPDGLDEETRNELIKRCNKVVDFYDSPELYVRSIRARLNNIASCRANLAERKFIQQWAEKYCPDDQ